ncbi:MAG: hypothetical protein FWG21_04410 [Oscillospiraceae bacterium]|nr:hypothetical protein [Oscillospiraceae bacterium]
MVIAKREKGYIIAKFLVIVVCVAFLIILACCIQPLIVDAKWFILLIPVILIAAVFLWRLISKAKNSVCIALFFVLLTVFGILIYILGLHLEQLPAWDFGRVQRGAWELTLNGQFQLESTIEYFQEYPNNFFPALYLFRWLVMFTDAGVKPGDTVLILNTLSLSLAILFIFLTFLRLKQPQQGLFTAIWCFLFAPFVLYASIYYTDTLSMPYVSAIIYVASILLTGEFKVKKQVIFAAVLAAVTGVGYLLKGTPVIAAIAAILTLFILRGRKTILFLVTFTVIFSITIFWWQSYTKDNPYLPSGESPYPSQLTAYHFIMMGLNKNGGYSEADHVFSTSIATIEEREAENKRIIMERIYEYGFIGMLGHLLEKIAFTWADGGYYAPYKISIEPISDSPLLEIVAYGGSHFKTFSSILSASQLMLLLLLALGFLRDSIKNSVKLDIRYMAKLAIFGLAFFLLIWETRSRYLVNFAPFLALLGAYEIVYLSDFLKKSASNVG